MKLGEPFFFNKSIEYIKSAAGHNPWYTGSIQRETRGRKEVRKKISKNNHPWGKLASCPGEKSMKLSEP
jgi:hypothetical protein